MLRLRTLAPGRRELNYSPDDSRTRLRKLQQVVAAADYDALLIIGGQDSEYNRGSQALIKYLLTGGSGSDLLGDIYLPTVDEAFEDCVLVIQESSVEIFYNANARKRLMPLLAKWRNLVEYQVLKREMEDSEVSEMEKIKSFIKMISRCKKVGIPAADPMKAEEWPLVQAFGLEGIGPGGFFTQRHTVMDCTAEVEVAMSSIDTFGLQKVVFRDLPLLEHHFGSLITDIDRLEQAAARAALSETSISEPLRSFFEYTSNAKSLPAGTSDGPPRVLIGPRSLDFPTEHKCTSTDIGAGGVGGAPALHFVAEGACPVSGLRVCRSYFFGTGKVPASRGNYSEGKDGESEEVPAEFAQQESKAQGSAQGLDLLFALSNAIVNALGASAAAFARSKNEATAKDAGLAALRESYGKQVGGFELLVSTFDSTGQLVDLGKADLGIPVLAYVRVGVRDVGSGLGSLYVGDSFAMGGVGVGGRAWSCRTLTADVPYFRTWRASGAEESAAVEMQVLLRDSYVLKNTLKLGDCLHEGGSEGALMQAHLFTGIQTMPVAVGTLVFYEHGFTFVSSSFHPVVVSFETDVETLLLASDDFNDNEHSSEGAERALQGHVDGIAGGEGEGEDDDDEALDVLVIGYKNPSSNPSADTLPVLDGGTAPFIAIPVGPGYEHRQEMLAVLPRLRSAAADLKIQFERGTSPLPRAFRSARRMLRKGAREQAAQRTLAISRLHEERVLSGTVSVGASTRSEEKEQDEAGPASSAFAGSGLLGLAEGEEAAADTALELPVSIMMGLPGSHVRELAEQLVDFKSEQAMWVVSVADDAGLESEGKTSEDEKEGVVADMVHKAMEGAIESALAKGGSRDRRPHVLLVLEGFIDPALAFRALASLGKQPRAGKPRIVLGSVTSCLSLTNLYADTRQSCFLPLVLEQCAEGCADNIVLTDCDIMAASRALPADATPALLRQRLKLANPSATLYSIGKRSFRGGQLPEIRTGSRSVQVLAARFALASSAAASSGSSEATRVAVKCAERLVLDRLKTLCAALLPEAMGTSPTPGSAMRIASAAKAKLPGATAAAAAAGKSQPQLSSLHCCTPGSQQLPFLYVAPLAPNSYLPCMLHPWLTVLCSSACACLQEALFSLPTLSSRASQACVWRSSPLRKRYGLSRVAHNATPIPPPKQQTHTAPPPLSPPPPPLSPPTVHDLVICIHHAPCTIHHTPYTTHHTPYSPYTIHHTHHTPYTMHHTPYTIHHTPYTTHHTLYTIHHTPYTIHHTPHTIHHTPHTIPHLGEDSTYTTPLSFVIAVAPVQCMSVWCSV
jgi:hypothetical protein